MQRRQMANLALAGLAVGALASSTPLLTAAAQGKITRDNWTEMVGFKPDVSGAPVGTTISAKNMSKAKSMLPDGLQKLITKYKLKLKVTEYEPIVPSEAYIEATNKGRGKVKAWDVGKNVRQSGWKGYEGGLPFPQPKDGLQVAYNFLNTYTGDDADRYYDVTWISAKRGVETTEYWHWTTMRTANRTDLEPIPHVKDFYEDRIKQASFTFALEPYDKKGFGALYFSSLDPQDLTGHVYVPAMRRVLRHSFGTRGDSWNATDFLYEDVGGYLGAAEWMNWKILDKTTMLLPADAGVRHGKGSKTVYDVDNWPHWNPEVDWQARPVYVLEAKPKLPDYPYSRMILLVDAETYTVPYKEAYDKKGELWKIILGGGTKTDSRDDKAPMMEPGFGMAIDLQAEHATLVSFRNVELNTDIDARQFTVSNLKKKSH